MIRRLGRALATAAPVTAIIGSAVVALGAAAPTDGAPPTTVQVAIHNFTFAPKQLVVHVGDTVVFQNADFVTHSATADSAMAWDTGDLGAGKRGRIVATRAGRFPYHCELHTNMTGVLVVK